MSASTTAVRRSPALGASVDLFGVSLTVTTYDHAVAEVMAAARARRSFALSALAVHGLMEAVRDGGFRRQVNSLSMSTPDGQPVRWAMNLLHGANLDDRVYGPELTWRVIEAAARESIGIYLYGSTPETCARFAAEIVARFPDAVIADVQPDRFRDATPDEDRADVERINASGAGVVLVGRGCPRQERWVADHLGRVNAAMLAVGAAFDYGAGTLAAPPSWMQRAGLQWLFRLGQEPGRLWRRYLFTNTAFVVHLARALVTSRLRTAVRRVDGAASVPMLTRARMRRRSTTAAATYEPELRILAALANPSDTLIDVGANDGLYTAALEGVVGKVVDFEPVPWLADRLEKTFPNAVVHRCALSDAPGSAVLRIPVIDGEATPSRSSIQLDGQADTELEVEVTLERLDAFGFTDPLVVKIDVEGHELAVVHGGADTLERRARVVLIESEERHLPDGPTRVIEWFRAHGFDGWVIVDGTAVDVVRYSRDVHQSTEMADAIEAGDPRPAGYGNNLLFVRAADVDAARDRMKAAGIPLG